MKFLFPTVNFTQFGPSTFRSKDNDSKKGIQMTLGYAIYIGWVGAALANAIAVLLFLGCCSSSEDEEEYDEYTPAHPMSYKSRN